MKGERGQAAVELLGALPALLFLGMALLQLLAVGYSSVLAGNAAEAAALAAAGGADPRSAARRALPGWSKGRARLRIAGGRAEVSLRPPSPIAGVSRRFEVTGTATVVLP